VPQPRPDAHLAQLTEREVQVLRLIVRGLTNAEIARELVVSDATAKTHVSNVLLMKRRVSTVSQATGSNPSAVQMAFRRPIWGSPAGRAS
jgi:DNA-binding NarL/FixJ family response regulator